LDLLGLGQLLDMILHRYIILPLLKRIFPKMLEEIDFIIGLEVHHIEGARNTILPEKIYLVSIVIDLLKYFKWTVPSPLSINLDFLLVGNLSLLRCTYTKSPGLNKACLCCLLA